MDNLKALLEDQYEWPSEYTFKFVVPTPKIPELKDMVSHIEKYQERTSRNGRFTSVTLRHMISSSDEVIDVYQKVSQIKGVISL